MLQLCSDCGTGDCFQYSERIYSYSYDCSGVVGWKSGGGLSSLAAMAGFNINTSSGADAIYPDLYPDIVSSTPFITGLFNIPVKDLEGIIDTTLYCYLDKYQRSPWWSVIISAPFKALGWVASLFKDEKDEDRITKLDPFHLTVKNHPLQNF